MKGFEFGTPHHNRDGLLQPSLSDTTASSVTVGEVARYLAHSLLIASCPFACSQPVRQGGVMTNPDR